MKILEMNVEKKEFIGDMELVGLYDGLHNPLVLLPCCYY